MTRTTDDYLSLIPPMNAGQPKFTATVAATVGPLADMQAAIVQMASVDFDLDTAVGAQLDAVGVRVGRSRTLSYPLQGIFFSFDDPARGLDKGIWKGPYAAGVGQSTLDDDTYRRLLRAKILANTWDGTVLGAQAVLDAYFDDPATLIYVEDAGLNYSTAAFTFDDPVRGFDVGQWALAGDALNTSPLDMIMVIGIAGTLPSLVDLALLAQGAFPIKPIGVTLDYAVTSVNDTPLFGFDVANAYIAGFDIGSMGVDPTYVAQNVIPQAA